MSYSAEPWAYRGAAYPTAAITAADGTPVADVCMRHDQGSANLALLMSSPALYAAAEVAAQALDNILGSHEGQAEWIELCRAVEGLNAALAQADAR